MTNLVLLGPSALQAFKILSPKGSEEQVPQSSPGLFTNGVLKKPGIERGGVEETLSCVRRC